MGYLHIQLEKQGNLYDRASEITEVLYKGRRIRG